MVISEDIDKIIKSIDKNCASYYCSLYNLCYMYNCVEKLSKIPIKLDIFSINYLTINYNIIIIK